MLLRPTGSREQPYYIPSSPAQAYALKFAQREVHWDGDRLTDGTPEKNTIF